MFFSKKAQKQQEEKILEKMSSDRDEIRKRLQSLSEIDVKLKEAILETSKTTTEVRGKVRRELKVAKKTLASVTKRVKDGVLIVSYSGRILSLNSAGEKMLGVDEKNVVNKSLANVVNEMKMIDCDTGDNLQLDPKFFARTSKSVYHHVHTENCSVNSDCDVVPSFIKPNSSTPINARISCQGKELSISFTCNLLDNDPEAMTDVSYVFVFKKKKG